MSLSNTYLESLESLGTWATVSEWAIAVGNDNPELLEKAEEEAKNQKKDTTGVRELAARISSNISRGAYVGHIEIDDSERPRQVRYLSEQEAQKLAKQDAEEDIAPLTRAELIRKAEAKLSTKDTYRLSELENIVVQLRALFALDFELEHARALLNPSTPGEHHPDNIQLLLKSHNRKKGSANWARFTLEEQIEYLRAVVRVQKLVSDKMSVDLEEGVLEQLIVRLKAVY